MVVEWDRHWLQIYTSLSGVYQCDSDSLSFSLSLFLSLSLRFHPLCRLSFDSLSIRHQCRCSKTYDAVSCLFSDRECLRLLTKLPYQMIITVLVLLGINIIVSLLPSLFSDRTGKRSTMPDSPADVKTQSRLTPPTMPPPPSTQGVSRNSSYTPTTCKSTPIKSPGLFTKNLLWLPFLGL